MATPAFALPSPQQYYGLRRRPRLAPLITGAASSYLPLFALEKQEEKEEEKAAIDLDQFNQRIALEKQGLADLRETFDLRESALDRRTKERADLDKLLTQRTISAQTRQAKKDRTLGFVKAGIGAAGLAVESGAVSAIWEGISTIGGWLGF